MKSNERQVLFTFSNIYCFFVCWSLVVADPNTYCLNATPLNVYCPDLDRETRSAHCVWRSSPPCWAEDPCIHRNALLWRHNIVSAEKRPEIDQLTAIQWWDFQLIGCKELPIRRRFQDNIYRHAGIAPGIHLLAGNANPIHLQTADKW